MLTLFDGFASLAEKVITRIWPDATEADKVKLEALKTTMASEMAIHSTNLEEAKHPSVFVAGWRPAVGWVCTVGLAYEFLLQPLAAWISSIAAVPTPPTLDTQSLITLLGGMLGLGIARTVEGVKGRKRSTWKD